MAGTSTFRLRAEFRPMDGVHWLSLLTLPMRPEAEIQTATQQILGPRPDLLETVVSILMERFPLLTRKDIMEIATIPAKDLRHTRVAQEWIEEGRLEGAAQGEAKVLPLKQLETLAVDAVFSEGVALLDFTGPADLAAWLEEHKG